jgi:hypothetical protein
MFKLPIHINNPCHHLEITFSVASHPGLQLSIDLTSGDGLGYKMYDVLRHMATETALWIGIEIS